MMRAASEGAALAGRRVAAVRIAREAGSGSSQPAHQQPPPPIDFRHSSLPVPHEAKADARADGSFVAISAEAGIAPNPHTPPSPPRGAGGPLVADYLPPGHSVICKHMPARKAGLTACGLRKQEGDHTAFVFLPGGEWTF